MTITDPKEGGKTRSGLLTADILAIAVLLLATALAFGAGMLVGKDRAQEGEGSRFWVEQLPDEAVIPNETAKKPQNGGPAAAAAALPAPDSGPQVYLASKSGSKYYLPTCGTAKRIKDVNRVWFATKEEAEAAGYEPAANCPGL
jgi:hypothetical protein